MKGARLRYLIVGTIGDNRWIHDECYSLDRAKEIAALLNAACGVANCYTVEATYVPHEPAKGGA